MFLVLGFFLNPARDEKHVMYQNNIRISFHKKIKIK